MERQILQILSAVGQHGISVYALTMHVYNMNATFFSQPDLDDIRNGVQRFLLKNSKSDSSLIERTERRGVYRLNTAHNADARQLMLEFHEEKHPEEKEEKPKEDLSLDLFG